MHSLTNYYVDLENPSSLIMPCLPYHNGGRRNLNTQGLWAKYWYTFQKHMIIYLPHDLKIAIFEVSYLSEFYLKL